VEKGQILNFYNEVTRLISDNINVSLTPSEQHRLTEDRTVDPEVYDLYLKGWFNLDQISRASLQKAADYFKLAIEKDPQWAAPYAGMANVFQYQMTMGFVEPQKAVPKIYEYLDKSLERDSNSADSYYQRAVTAVWVDFEWEKGEAAFRKALELNSSNSLCNMFYAHLLTILRRNQEALRYAKKAQELDPENPFILGLYGAVLAYAAKDYKGALAQAEKALSIDSDHYFAKRVLYGASADLGDYETAFEGWKEANIAKWEEFGVTELFEKTLHERGWIALHEEVIRLNEEEWVKVGRYDPIGLANIYLRVKNYDKAVAYLEKAYELHVIDPYISTSMFYDQLKDHPGYRELLKKMKLPID